MVLVIVKSRLEGVEPAMHFIDSTIGKHSRLKMKSVGKDVSELIYEVKYEQLLKTEKSNKFDLARSLLDIDGVIDVNQVGKDVNASL
jgi:hypothetical protein